MGGGGMGGGGMVATQSMPALPQRGPERANSAPARSPAELGSRVSAIGSRRGEIGSRRDEIGSRRDEFSSGRGELAAWRSRPSTCVSPRLNTHPPSSALPTVANAPSLPRENAPQLHPSYLLTCLPTYLPTYLLTYLLTPRHRPSALCLRHASCATYLPTYLLTYLLLTYMPHAQANAAARRCVPPLDGAIRRTVVEQHPQGPPGTPCTAKPTARSHPPT